MNIAQLVTIAVPFVILLGAIVAGSWINQRALERQIEAFRHEIKAEMTAMRAEVRAEIAPLRSNAEQLKQSVEKMERLFEAIFSKMVLPK